MGKARFTEKELKDKLQYNGYNDKHGKVFMPNYVFEMLANDEELSASKSFHQAYTYSYLYLVSWLYRNAKYDTEYSKEDLREIIGLSKTYQKFNYVTNKDGVLDRLALTVEDKIKNAPVYYDWENETLNFYNQEEYNNEFLHEGQVEENRVRGINKKSPNGTYKIPTFGVYSKDAEYGEGTFFGFIENTHHVDFEVFVKCMTNPELGAEAFYLYSYLTYKCNQAGGSIEIGGIKMLQQTGMKHTSKEKALKGLKKFGLIDCYPAVFYKGAGKGDGASVYVVKDVNCYESEGRKFAVRQVKDADALEEIEKIKKQVDELMM